MKKIITLIIICFITSCGKQNSNIQKDTSLLENQEATTSNRSEIHLEKNNPARDIIKKVMVKTGTINDLKRLKDVQYTYVLNAVSLNMKNVSKERYVFEGELSWAEYLPDLQYPKRKDTITEAFNGKDTWVRVNKKTSDDSRKIRFASFVRKTNFYWFTMMQKLLDPGVNHKLLTPRAVDNIEYQIIEITFNQNIGEVQDRYLLYFNRETELVDQFLFTVKEFDYAPSIPMLMQIKYSLVDGILLMTERIVRKSNWDGKVNGEIVYKQYCKDIKFNNSFNTDIFHNNRN